MNDLLTIIAIAALIYNTSPLPDTKEQLVRKALSAIALLWCLIIVLRSLGIG